jgi:predicted HicB family RNase H-like nuclease
MSAKSYSGKFLVRSPPGRHKALAMQAAKQGIRLNRHVTDELRA